MNRDETVPEDLEAAVRERENNRCCLTGEKDNLKATYIVPPSLFDDDDLQPGVLPLTLPQGEKKKHAANIVHCRADYALC